MTHCNNIDLKMEEAINNQDIQKIMAKACRSFSPYLDVDEIYTCKLNALWKSFKNFKPEKNTKFTTYLYNGVYIECLKELKFKNKSKRNNGKLHENIPNKDANLLIIDIMDEVESQEEMELLQDKLSNMTINEMAEKRLYSRETVRKKIKKIGNRIKSKFK
jgi:DNA-directed RNA polymerase specialized sigma subunit